MPWSWKNASPKVDYNSAMLQEIALKPPVWIDTQQALRACWTTCNNSLALPSTPKPIRCMPTMNAFA
jgi:hypothetical protein